MSNAPHGALVLAGIAGERLGCTAVAHVVLTASGSADVVTLEPASARRSGDSIEAGTARTVSPGQPILPGFDGWSDTIAVVHLADGVGLNNDAVTTLAEIASGARLTVVTGDSPGADGAAGTQFGASLNEFGLVPTFAGCARRGSLRAPADVVAAVLEPSATQSPMQAPDDFKVVAILTAFNEEDIIVSTIEYLVDQGIEVHLVDNWSTDATAELATAYLGKGVVAIEQFPPSGPTGSFDLAELTRHVEDLTASLGADWFVHHDVDERRLSPWPGVSLRDGLFTVDQRGYTAIDHSQIDFHPTDNTFVPGTDPEAHFEWFDMPIVVRENAHVKAWKNLGLRVDLASSGGHQAQFAGRKLPPYNFLLKHYPFRSQQHGEKKVLNERKPRWNAEERSKGWHFGYDHVRQGHSFLKSKDILYHFDDDFPSTYLLERLSPIAVPAEDLSYTRKLRRSVVPFLRRTGLLSAAVWLQRRYRVLRRRDVASGRR